MQNAAGSSDTRSPRNRLTETQDLAPATVENARLPWHAPGFREIGVEQTQGGAMAGGYEGPQYST